MEFTPDISEEKIKNIYENFKGRILVYKKKGLDLIRSREFMLNKAEPLQEDILEIGAGSGYTTVALARAGYKFISIDKDKEALERTALKLAYENILANVRFYLMDGNSLEFRDASFGSIFVVNLFHHLNDADRMLSEIVRVLYNGGKAVLADFNKRGMEIVNLVHRQEGRIHQDSGIGRDLVYSYFKHLGFGIESYYEECHWLLIVNK
jgi:ubiquinone/menaquinone biosynthesis C-methylase UbiE